MEVFLDNDSPLMDSLHKLINPRKLQLVLNFELVTTKSMLGNYKLPSMFEVGITWRVSKVGAFVRPWKSLSPTFVWNDR